METAIFIALMLLYYTAVNFSAHKLYSSASPEFPLCLLYNGGTVAVVCCIGILGMALGYVLGQGTDIKIMLLYYLGMYMLSVLTVTDLKEKLIPNKFLLIMIGVWTVYILINLIIDLTAALQILAVSLSGMIFNGLVFIMGYYLTRKKLGGGDVKLAAVLGFFFTIDKSFGVLLYGLMLCSLFSIVLLITKKAKAGTQIPLCPFLYAGAVIMLLIN